MRYEIIPFGEQQFAAFEDNGEIRVAIRPVSETLGLAWNGQFERINRHPVLSANVRVTRTVGTREDREMVTLDLENFHGWLVTISSERISDTDKRAMIVEYQRRAFRAIYEHFHGPMTGSKTWSISSFEMIALQKEGERAMRALLKEGRPVMRDYIYDGLKRTNARLGQPTLAIDQIGRTALSYADQAAPFFDVLKALEDKGVAWNHSRKPHKLWAISMPEIERLATANGMMFRLDDDMSVALRASLTPPFVDVKTVNSITGRFVHCWVFEAPVLH